MIGQNRAEAAQLTAHLKEMNEVGERVSKARNVGGPTITSYVQMYDSIDADVQLLESTLQRLKVEMRVYDTKFPAQHEDTLKGIAGIEKGLKRATLLKQQIGVAKRIQILPTAEQVDVWKGEMLPLLTEEDDLDNAK